LRHKAGDMTLPPCCTHRSLIQQKKLPWVPNTGVYILMVGNGITYNEMCTKYCGWHDVFAYSATDGKNYQVPFASVGNVAKCYSICSIYSNGLDKTAPNHPEIDGTASIFAHEVVEAISNPGTGGWYASLWVCLYAGCPACDVMG
jgi:hypothetical protein